MKRIAAALSVMALTVYPAAAQPLLCFGNEPFWSMTHSVSARASTPDGAFLAGCCRVPAAQAGAQGVQSTSFEGTAWRLVTLPGQPPATIAALRRAITIRFESGRVSGFSGCNTFSGPFTLNQNRLTFGTLAGTMMACIEPEIGRLESAFKTALADPLSYAIAGDRLTLTTDSGAVLTFEKEAPVALEGGMWSVTGYNNGRQAVVSPLVNSRLTMAFEDGTASGNAGCNMFRATYTADERTLKFGPAATTRRMCPNELMSQERAFLAAIASTSRWVIEGGMLHLHRADGERVLTAARR
jgi:heat shock protein HslJ